MYVWARLLKSLATTKRRGSLQVSDTSRLEFRCLPFDIDSNMHLNNARYLMLADVGRIDFYMRSGLIQLIRERGWTPLMGGVQTAYVREIRLWKKFSVQTRLATWEGTTVIGRHRFMLEDGTEAATVLTTAGIYDFSERRFIPIEELANALGYQDKAPEPNETERHFMETHQMLRAEVKRNR